MQRALEGLRAAAAARARRCGVAGNREYNPGWHTALDLHNLLTVSEAITRAALERKESRGGQFRDDFPTRTPTSARSTSWCARAPDGEMQLERVPLPRDAGELKADHRGDEVGLSGSLADAGPLRGVAGLEVVAEQPAHPQAQREGEVGLSGSPSPRHQ